MDDGENFFLEKLDFDCVFGFIVLFVKCSRDTSGLEGAYLNLISFHKQNRNIPFLLSHLSFCGFLLCFCMVSMSLSPADSPGHSRFGGVSDGLMVACT
jgi:hypothetical protein